MDKNNEGTLPAELERKSEYLRKLLSAPGAAERIMAASPVQKKR